MKKALALFLSLAMILGLAACSSTSSSSAGASSAAAEEPASSAPVSQETAESDDFQAALDDILANATDDSLQRVLDAGVLTCGCEGNWIPFLYYSEEDPDYLTGFDAEVARCVADKLGVDIKFDVASQFDGILAGLQSKRYDIITEGLKKSTVDPFEGLTTSTLYHQDMPIVIVAADNTDIVDIASMNGKKAGNSTTSSYGKIAFNAGCECNPDLDFAMAIQGILNGTIDLTVNSMVVYETYLETYPEAADKLKIAFVYEAENPEDLQGGITVRTEDASLKEAIDLALTDLLEDGTIMALSDEFMGEAYTEQSPVFDPYR
ncbi:transporter substrate-binding domain-containing protein [Ruthenibacterium sp.]|uniref:transporter substrate-binding domain-containing protein n=1 Tax=Ruthenibacterium sp. TaxID=1905345 RepID=UPI00257CFDF8|nr:transporter substrate-binding domain-containing protein [Ruthenibacterium sp.]MBQ1358949.1 transporter substrate-binding domain-containing protein [Ruthenibacterium sp.]